jgi:uncharacterized membrane protein
MTPRLPAVDMARGLAVLAMFVFHFIWDLGHFGHIDAEFPYSPGVKAFGHAVALSFLFIAGVSLALAHGRGFRARAFWRRWAVVAAAAALVSAATYAAFPQAFVFFGILHCIAAASLLALPFLFLPWPAAIVAAAALALAPLVARNAFFDAPFFWWTGLSTYEPLTNDYRPLMPWAGAALAGLGAALALRGRLLAAAPGGPPGRAGGALAWLGRRSLPLYLLHQPLFFAGFTALALLAPAAPEVGFEAACRAQCAASGGEESRCRAACGCTAREVARQGALSGAASEEERRARVEAIARACISK